MKVVENPERSTMFLMPPKFLQLLLFANQYVMAFDQYWDESKMRKDFPDEDSQRSIDACQQRAKDRMNKYEGAMVAWLMAHDVDFVHQEFVCHAALDCIDRKVPQPA